MSGYDEEEPAPRVIFLPDGTPVMFFDEVEIFTGDAKSPEWEALEELYLTYLGAA